MMPQSARSNIFQVSQSKVNIWRRCHEAYHYAHVRKLRKKAKKRPLMFGGIVHQMLEEKINGRRPFAVLTKLEKEQGKTFRILREEYGDILDDTRIIMTEYFDYWKQQGDITYIPMKKRAEHTFELEIKSGLVVTGKIDAFAQTKNKLKWLVEHKTHGKSIPQEDHRWRNLQSSVYHRFVEILGLLPLDGTLWDYIRSKPPSRPKPLKSGKMSQRGLDTLPTAVIETLEEHNLKVSSFATMVKSAESNRRNYFQRIFTPLKKDVVDLVYDDFVNTALEIADNHGKKRDKNIGMHCSWCDFEPLCRAHLTGGDVEFLIKKDYTKNDYKITETPDFEGDAFS